MVRGWVSRDPELVQGWSLKGERRAAEGEEPRFLVSTWQFSYMTSYGPPRNLVRCTQEEKYIFSKETIVFRQH